MDGREARDGILRRRTIDPVDKLGEGDEAEVFAFGSDRVLRLFKRSADAADLERRLAFHAALDRRQAAFAVPLVIERGNEDGVAFTVEGRILGTSLAAALPGLEGTRRRRALLAYAEAVSAIGDLGTFDNPDGRFGEILVSQPIRAETWAGFVLARCGACLEAARHRLFGQLDRPDSALTRLGEMLSGLPAITPRLVHGDYYPANVMVDREGRITGVIDFGGLSLAGDARMDAAAALLHLTGLDGITAEDRQVVRSGLAADGLGEEHLALYRLFYAFRFLDTSRDGLFRWCVAVIRAAC